MAYAILFAIAARSHSFLYSIAHAKPHLLRPKETTDFPKLIQSTIDTKQPPKPLLATPL